MGFRAGCREQAGKAISLLGRWFGAYAPKGGRRVAFRVGCLFLAPFLTLGFWLIQAIIWCIVAIPILAYALLMAIIGGGFHGPPAETVQVFLVPDPTQTGRDTRN